MPARILALATALEGAGRALSEVIPSPLPEPELSGRDPPRDGKGAGGGCFDNPFYFDPEGSGCASYQFAPEWCGHEFVPETCIECCATCSTEPGCIPEPPAPPAAPPSPPTQPSPSPPPPSPPPPPFEPGVFYEGYYSYEDLYSYEGTEPVHLGTRPVQLEPPYVERICSTCPPQCRERATQVGHRPERCGKAFLLSSRPATPFRPVLLVQTPLSTLRDLSPDDAEGPCLERDYAQWKKGGARWCTPACNNVECAYDGGDCQVA